jgi:hypothetical protein
MEIFDEGKGANKFNCSRIIDQYEPNVSQNEYDLNLTSKRNFHIQRARTEKYLKDSLSNINQTYERKMTVKNSTKPANNASKFSSDSDDLKIYKSITQHLKTKDEKSPLMNMLFLKRKPQI